MPLLEFDAYISPDGVIYVLDGIKDRALLFGVNGQGMPPIEYLTERGPHQHGETIIDYRLRPRVLQMLLRRNGTSRSDYWENRCELLNVLRPNRQRTLGRRPAPGKLRKILPNQAIRDIDVFIEQGPDIEQGQGVWDEWSFETVMRFIAPDPTFYNPNETEIAFSTGVDGELKYPAAYPVIYSGGEFVDFTEDITYDGTWDALPIVTIRGPVNSPAIYNETTGEKIEMDYVVPLGRTITIDLSYDAKTVQDDLGANLIGTLTEDSDLGTFHLATAPDAPGGVNSFRVTGGDVITSSRISLRWNTRFIGL